MYPDYRMQSTGELKLKFIWNSGQTKKFRDNTITTSLMFFILQKPLKYISTAFCYFIMRL